ncbi:MAG: hypothetical protein ACLP1X_33225 [Polyangiaceae bacterium]
MRRLGAKALAWSALAMATAGAAAGTGCKGTRPTELVPGVSTQMVVTKDLDVIRIDVEANGVTKFCNQYQVAPNGVVQLPSTLGVLPEASPDTLVTITIRGYDVPGSTGNDYMNCGSSPVDALVDPNLMTGPGPRILRRSIQSYVPGQILFVPMPLTYACQDVDCSMMGPTYACKGGLCLDSTIADSSTLVDFDPALLDGTGLCFSPKMCFEDAFPAAPVDADNCIYGFPPYDTPLAGTGTNVRIYYKDITWQPNAAGGWEQVVAEAGEEEILNEDPLEGFTIVNAADAGLPDASGSTLPGVDAGPTYNTKGPLIQLAKGLCNLAKAATTPPPHPVSGSAPLTYHTISDVQIASLCPPKELLLPICAAERNNSPVLPDGGTTTGACNVAIPMDPAPSAMYLVMDQSVYMHGAYGAAGSAQALALSLTDPVFKETFAAFKFLNDPTEKDCSATPPSTYLTPTLPFDLADDAQPQIATALSGWTASEIGGGTCPTGNMGTGATFGCPVNQYCYLGQCYTPYPLDLQGAMQSAASGVGAYAEVQSFLTQSQIASPNVAGVMFIVNRAPVSGPGTPPEAQDCTPALTVPSSSSDPAFTPNCGEVDTNSTVSSINCPADDCTCPPGAALQTLETEAQNAFSASGLRTYFVVLGNDDASPEPLTFFQTLAMDVPQAVTTLDATMLNSATTGALSPAAMTDVGNFLQSITQLGTCLYQLPPDVISGTPAANIEVSFSAPGAPPGAGVTIVKPVTGCTAAAEAGATPPDGWSYDGTDRIRLCGAPCSTLRALVIGAAATETAVPVTIANLCSGTTSVPTSTADSGTSSTAGEPDATGVGADDATATAACSPATCMFGCCQGGQCITTEQDNACGTNGGMCQDCGVGTCVGGACNPPVSDAGP